MSSRSLRRGGLELQRNAVHAVALAARRRAVVEHVAEMAAAAPAMHFLARDDQAEIVRRAYRVRDRRIEARPPGAAVELGVGTEQVEIAGGATEHAGAMLAVERAGERALGAVLAQHPELRRSEQPLPLLLGPHHLERLGPGVARAEQRR